MDAICSLSMLSAENLFLSIPIIVAKSKSYAKQPAGFAAGTAVALYVQAKAFSGGKAVSTPVGLNLRFCPTGDTPCSK
jgi:hypothetical protein